MGRTSRQMYKMQRSWGVPVALYRVINGSVDRKTGQLELVTNKTIIKRGVVTPVDERYFKNVQIGDKGLLVTVSVLPVGREDYFIIDGIRYSVVSHQEIDDSTYFHLREIQKQMRHATIDAQVEDNLGLEDDNAGNRS